MGKALICLVAGALFFTCAVLSYIGDQVELTVFHTILGCAYTGVAGKLFTNLRKS